MSLTINALSFGYRHFRLFEAIEAIDIRRGEITAVVGPNGVGKSSLFRLIAGLLKPQAGSVALDDIDLSRLGKTRRHETVFFLSQHVGMRAALSVFDVVLLARKSGRGGRASAADILRVEEVLDQLGIGHALRPAGHGPVRRATATRRHGPGSCTRSADPSARRAHERARSQAPARGDGTDTAGHGKPGHRNAGRLA